VFARKKSEKQGLKKNGQAAGQSGEMWSAEMDWRGGEASQGPSAGRESQRQSWIETVCPGRRRKKATRAKFIRDEKKGYVLRKNKTKWKSAIRWKKWGRFFWSLQKDPYAKNQLKLCRRGA